MAVEQSTLLDFVIAHVVSCNKCEALNQNTIYTCISNGNFFQNLSAKWGIAL